MSYSWQRMSLEEYVVYQRSMGERIVRVGDLHWRRVRPFFYRPLLPFAEYFPGSIRAPILARFGGCQFAVNPGVKSNSSINLLIYKDPQSYSLAALDRHKRHQVRSAAREFMIRPIETAKEFKENAYPVYLSFYARTGYGYHAERRHRALFNTWSDRLFKFSKVTILGAYRNGQLGAVNISELVEDTLHYETGFCDDASLHRHATSFFLDAVLKAAAQCPEIKSVYAGPYKYKGRSGVDRFFFERGCALVQKPAVIRLNPFANAIVRHFLPKQHHQLYGSIEGEQSRSGITEPPVRFGLGDACS